MCGEPLSRSVVHLLSVPCYHYHSTCSLLLRTTPNKNTYLVIPGYDANYEPLGRKGTTAPDPSHRGHGMYLAGTGTEGIMERHGEEKKTETRFQLGTGRVHLSSCPLGLSGLGHQGGLRGKSLCTSRFPLINAYTGRGSQPPHLSHPSYFG
jgi:hypothetical protein